METFKVLKFGSPAYIKNLINLLPRRQKLMLTVPLVKLDITQQNFAFQCTQIWNELTLHIFEKCPPTEGGLIIPGSVEDSDLAASSGSIKRKLRHYLLSQQKLGNPTNWQLNT